MRALSQQTVPIVTIMVNCAGPLCLVSVKLLQILRWVLALAEFDRFPEFGEGGGVVDCRPSPLSPSARDQPVHFQAKSVGYSNECVQIYAFPTFTIAVPGNQRLVDTSKFSDFMLL